MGPRSLPIGTLVLYLEVIGIFYVFLIVKRITKAIVIAICGVGLSSCVHATEQKAPCFDGWVVDESGTSEVWNPSVQDVEMLQPFLPSGAEYICAHRLPSGRIIFLSEGDDVVYATEFMTEGDGYKFLTDGFVVGHWN